MGRRKTALRALKNLCAFIGAIALFSYFYNWTVDLRHWYVTVGSAFVCLILWVGFYSIEGRKDAVTHFLLSLLRLGSGWLSHAKTKAELPSLPPAMQPENEIFNAAREDGATKLIASLTKLSDRAARPS